MSGSPYPPFPTIPSLEYEGTRLKLKDNGDGTFSLIVSGVSGGSSITLQVNGTPNSLQTLLNLIAGSNITITDNGSGGVVIAGVAAGAPPASFYVLGKSDVADLPNSIVNPTAYYGPDIAPASPGSLDDEFNQVAFDTTRWTIVNPGGLATFLMGRSCVTIKNPAAGSGVNDFAGAQQATPATPWIVVAHIRGLIPAQSANRIGLFISDGTRYIQYSIFDNNPTKNWLVQWYTAANTFSSTQANIIAATETLVFDFFFGIQDDGTSLNFLFSTDGINYWQIHHEARLAFLSAVSQVGFFINPAYSTSAGSGTSPEAAGALGSIDWFRLVTAVNKG